MEIFGEIVVYIIMACAVISAVVSIVNEKHPLGQKFLEGIDSIGPIFLPVAGILASVPFLTGFITSVLGPVFSALGADAAMAATTIVASDMGGYQLAEAIAKTRESWIMALTMGYMSGATIVFSIPVALRMLKEGDRKYLALGVMSGLLAIPVGVFISSAIMAISNPMIREIISTNAQATYQLALTFSVIMCNLIPWFILCGLILAGLIWQPKGMIKGFLIIGKIIDATLRLVFVFAIVEYSSHFFSNIIGWWGFDPIMADEVNFYRAAEVSCAIGAMLCGAFPMVYMIQTYLKKPLAAVGRMCHLSVSATTGILAATANVLALFGIVKDLVPEDKIKCIAYSVCAAFLVGDHLLMLDSFQPTLTLPIMIGKFLGGCFAIFLAAKIAVPQAKLLAKEEFLENSVKIKTSPKS